MFLPVCFRTFAGHKGAVWSCQLDPTGSLAATASGDFSVQVWDAITGQSLWQSFPHKHIVKTCDFSPDSRRLATGGHEGVLRVFDLNSAAAAKKKVEADLLIPQSGDAANKITISKCKWWTNDILLTGCSDGKIRFWQINGEGSKAAAPDAPTHVLETDGAEVRDMELTRLPASSGGGDILTVAAGDKVYFFQLQEKKLLKEHKMPIHFRDEGGASLHPLGQKFVTGKRQVLVLVQNCAMEIYDASLILWICC